MPKERAIEELLAQASLVICAHGSPGVGDLLQHRVAALQKQRCFAEIAGAALYGEPDLEQTVTSRAAEPIFVVPLFLSAGVTFSALEARLAKIHPSRRTVLCQPLGTHPDLPTRMGAAARQQVLARGWRPDETGILLVGHGSHRSDASRNSTETMAAAISSQGRFAEVAVALLEGGMTFEDALANMKSPQIVVLGCLVEKGRHASEDLPKLAASADRPAIYTAPINAAPWCDQLIVDQARRSAADLLQLAEK